MRKLSAAVRRPIALTKHKQLGCMVVLGTSKPWYLCASNPSPDTQTNLKATLYAVSSGPLKRTLGSALAGTTEAVYLGQLGHSAQSCFNLGLVRSKRACVAVICMPFLFM